MIDALVRIIDRLIQLKQYKNQRLEKLYDELFKPTYGELLEVHRDYLQLFEQTRQLMPSMEFLVVAVVPWKGEYSYAMFNSQKDAKLFVQAESIEEDEIAELILKRNFSVDYREAASGKSMQIFFEDLDEASEFAMERNLGEPSLAPDVELPAGTLKSIRGVEEYVREARLRFDPVRTKIGSLGRALRGVELGASANEFVEDVVKYFPQGTFDTSEESEFGGSTAATSVLEVLRGLEGTGDAEVDPYSVNKMTSEVEFLLWDLESLHKEKWERVSESFAAVTREVVVGS